MSSRISDIKRAQKESLLLRKISHLYQRAAQDDKRLQDLFISRVELSKDKSICDVYFYTSKGKEYFDEKLEVLKLYKPSLRKALASVLSSRYVPDLRFKFDSKFEKQIKIEELIEKVKEEDKL